MKRKIHEIVSGPLSVVSRFVLTDNEQLATDSVVIPLSAIFPLKFLSERVRFPPVTRLTLQPVRLIPATLTGEGRHLAGMENEHDLLTRAGAGDHAAFDRLILMHEPRVRRLAHRLLSWRAGTAELDDVVQDVFVRLLENLRSLRDEARLSTWLTSVTLNRCRTIHRRRWVQLNWLRSRRIALDEAASDARSLRDETAARVQSAVQALRPKDREVIVLFYLEDHSAADIATLLGASQNAIEVRLHRARARLKILLSDLVVEG